MASLDDVVRPPWPLEGSEEHVLWTFLDFQRATLATKCRGLTSEQLSSVAIPPSNLSLLGILRHMVDHERFWYEEIFLGRDSAALYGSEDDPDFDFNELASEPLETVVDNWIRQCEVTRTIIAGQSLDTKSVATPDWEENPFSLRFLAVHSIEEYARHCGHADLLRQTIDGMTGY
jgi:hypothetical protein